jgi:DNA-binding NarL/FixJ family response regulator
VARMRILLADNQPKVRFALRTLLDRLPDLEVIGEAWDAAELLSLASAVVPDLLLMAWSLPGEAPVDLLSALRRRHPRLPVIVLSGRPEARSVALRAGASAFVYQCDPPETLLAAIVDCWYVLQPDLRPQPPGAELPAGRIHRNL